MELKKISWFLRIVDCGSLSKSAKSLYLTQPTLSRFLKKLEEDVGAELFSRGKNGTLALTRAGKLYYETALQIHALWNTLDAELSAIRKDENPIVFGVCGDYLHDYAAECAEKVRARYPDVSVNIFCDGSHEIQRQVADGVLRLGLCAYQKEDPALTFIPCAREEMKLVVSQDHPLAQQAGSVSLHRLKTPGFALMRTNTVLRETVDDYFRAIGYAPNIKRTYMRHSAIADVLCDGEHLLGFCPENNLSGRLSYITLDPPFYYRQGVCYPKNAELTPAEKYLVELLQKQPAQRILD